MKTIISKGAPDEVLILNDLSLHISISDLIDYINQKGDEIIAEQYSTEDLLRSRRTDGINDEHLDQISLGRLNEPLIATVLNDENWIIDGNHRLVKRAIEQYPKTHVVILSEEEIKNFSHVI